MSLTPIMPYSCNAQAQRLCTTNCFPSAPQQKAPEAFEGEGKMLKDLYDNYMKNAGGYQMINGQRVHVTTVLHTDTRAQQAAIAIEKRLRELGELPPFQQPQQMIY